MPETIVCFPPAKCFPRAAVASIVVKNEPPIAGSKQFHTLGSYSYHIVSTLGISGSPLQTPGKRASLHP